MKSGYNLDSTNEECGTEKMLCKKEKYLMNPSNELDTNDIEFVSSELGLDKSDEIALLSRGNPARFDSF